jgi:hypothetical protein
MPSQPAHIGTMPLHANRVAVQAALAQAQHWTVRDFLTYYSGIHPAAALPGRDAFDPMAIPRLLPHLILADIERDGSAMRFRVRVAGEEIVHALRMPLIGRYLDEIAKSAEPTVRFTIESRHAVAETGRMVYFRGPPRVRFSLDYAEIEYAHCPLAEDGVTVDRIVSLFHYQALEPVSG